MRTNKCKRKYIVAKWSSDTNMVEYRSHIWTTNIHTANTITKRALNQLDKSKIFLEKGEVLFIVKVFVNPREGGSYARRDTHTLTKQHHFHRLEGIMNY